MICIIIAHRTNLWTPGKEHWLNDDESKSTGEQPLKFAASSRNKSLSGFETIGW
jgi:hypothetical protein